jgi:hypothetical protein
MSAERWPVAVDPVFGCWIWTGKVDQRDGYALIWRGKFPIKAHLAVYTAEVGPIADGMTLEHRCRVRLCVRPGHLLPMTMSENLLRRKWSVRVRRDLCELKHDAINAMTTKEGGRLCRICDR